MRYVALLRGVNVGGKNKLPMKDLVGLVEKAGGREVSTFIASGNAIFTADAGTAAKMPAELARSIKARFGFAVPVVVRSHDQLVRVARNNPFLDERADLDILLVMFLAAAPSAAAVNSLDPVRSPPDELVVRGADVYLCCPNGFAKTKLSNAWLDSKLGTVSTGRNWRTVLKLVELTA